MDDESVLNKASRENWILITNDKDFGEHVYREQKPHPGIILLRLSDERGQSKISSIQKLLVDFADRLVDQFVHYRLCPKSHLHAQLLATATSVGSPMLWLDMIF